MSDPPRLPVDPKFERILLISYHGYKGEDLTLVDVENFSSSVGTKGEHNARVLTRNGQSVVSMRSYDSIAREGDICLPIEICILRREETFKQWTARAKEYSIKAVRESTGGTMHAVARRLGLTFGSLKGHLHRARHTQTETLFD